MTTEMAVAKEFASYLNKFRHLHWALQVNQRNVISFRSLRHNDQLKFFWKVHSYRQASDRGVGVRVVGMP